MPRLKLQDFTGAWFNPEVEQWSSRLPSSVYLNNTTLDPALLFQGKPPPALAGGLAVGNGLQDILKRRQALGSVWQQQFLLYDIGANVGVPGGTVDAVTQGLQAFSVTWEAVSNAQTLSDYLVITTAIGSVGQLLSAIPTIYTQIAGAIVNFGLGVGGQIIDAINKDKPSLPAGQKPFQQFDGDTDEYQFNVSVREAVTNHPARNYTALFAPRFQGYVTAELRKSGGTQGIAWGMGNGKVDTDKNEAEFDPTGGIGFMPGGRRITSLIQCMFYDDARPTKVGGIQPDTIFDPRCGESARVVQALDVGEYYPGTSNGCLTVWDWLNKLSQVMYTVNAQALDDLWRDHTDRLWAGIDQYWANQSYENFWGCSTWEGAVQALASSYCVGINGTIGGFGAWSPDEMDKGKLGATQRDEFENNNVYHRLIKRALWELRQRQLYYLKNTVIAAYLPSEGAAVNATMLMGSATDPDVNGAFVEARKRILDGQEKHWVKLHEVQDPAYREAIEAAGGGWVPPHEGTIITPLPPTQPVPGIAVPEGIPPAPPAPDPGGGAPFGDIAQPYKPGAPDPEPSWLAKYGPYVAGGVALAGAGYLAYRHFTRKSNGLYLPPSVG